MSKKGNKKVGGHCCPVSAAPLQNISIKDCVYTVDGIVEKKTRWVGSGEVA